MLRDPAWCQTEHEADYDEVYAEVDDSTVCGCGEEKPVDQMCCDDCYVRLRDDR